MKLALVIIFYLSAIQAFIFCLAGELTKATVAGAISAAAFLLWGYLDYRAERTEQMRRGREAVWARRDAEADLFDIPFWQLPESSFDEDEWERRVG